MEIIKLSTKGQIVIPRKIRKELDIQEGTLLGIEKVNNLAVLKKIDLDLEKQFKNSLNDLKKAKIKQVA